MRPRSKLISVVFLPLFFLMSLGVWAGDYWVIIDEHNTPLPTDGQYYNYTGGDRGILNAGETAYSRDGESSYKATIAYQPGNWTYGGMWYSLIRINRDNIPLNFKAIFGPYIKSAYQGEIIEVEVTVSSVRSPSSNSDFQLRIELKGKDDRIISANTWTDLKSLSYPRTFNWVLATEEKQDIKLVLWIIDRAQIGDSISIDRIRLKARVPSLATKDQAFLWSYSWLMRNYNPGSGMVQDRSNFGTGDFENVPATAKAAKATYYAYRKGFVTLPDTTSIITKIADTLIRVLPRGPAGKNSLWPHFTKLGGSVAIPPHDGFAGTEWPSGDTSFAALDIIAVLQMLGDPQHQIPALIRFLQDINWPALLMPNGGISHGYTYEGDLLSSTWRGFGMETIGVNWAYASATGRVADMLPPPSDNGSGFIDNAQYPMVLSVKDRWGNNWAIYRSQAADKQINWYKTSPHKNDYLTSAGLFGLSAAEVPNIYFNPPVKYLGYGVGGRYSPVEDGNHEVVVLHYAAMIADIRLAAATKMWENLRDRSIPLLKSQVIISPLNNMESLAVSKTTGKMTINYLKGSWNLALQAEGWALSDSALRTALFNAIQANAFLQRGYRILTTQTQATSWTLY